MVEGVEGTVKERVASTQIVGLGAKSLAVADCSSIGWFHLAFVPARGDRSGLVGAYSKRMLPLAGRVPEAPFYLVGGEVIGERALELDTMCVSYRGRINATPQWVVPIADDAELAVWRERIANGLCGRAPVR